MSRLTDLMDIHLGTYIEPEETVEPLGKRIDKREQLHLENIKFFRRNQIKKFKPLPPSFWDEFEPSDKLPAEYPEPKLSYYGLIKLERERCEPEYENLIRIDWYKVKRMMRETNFAMVNY